MKRLLRIVLAVFMLTCVGVMAAPPARACACGAIITDDASYVEGETALIVDNGTTKELHLVMHLNGSPSEAAWVMPLPSVSDVELSDEAIFTALEELTKPIVKKEWDWSFSLGNRAGAPESSTVEQVTVISSQEVGPFQVTTIKGTSGDAIDTWLADNDFPTRPDLTPTFDTYVDQGWEFAAIKLTPKGAETFTSTLPPLKFTLRSSETVYPIRLSQLAQTSQYITLYVTSDHRQQIRHDAAPKTPLEVTFAGKVKADDIHLDGTELFLTKFRGVVDPDDIIDDYVFADADTDEPAHLVTYETVYVGSAVAMATGIFLMVFVPLMAITQIGAIGMLIVRRVQRVANRPRHHR